MGLSHSVVELTVGLGTTLSCDEVSGGVRFGWVEVGLGWGWVVVGFGFVCLIDVGKPALVHMSSRASFGAAV